MEYNGGWNGTVQDYKSMFYRAFNVRPCPRLSLTPALRRQRPQVRILSGAPAFLGFLENSDSQLCRNLHQNARIFAEAPHRYRTVCSLVVLLAFWLPVHSVPVAAPVRQSATPIFPHHRFRPAETFLQNMADIHQLFQSDGYVREMPNIYNIGSFLRVSDIIKT